MTLIDFPAPPASADALAPSATESVCPVCLATVPAERCVEGDAIVLVKTCPDHGSFSAPVWRGLASHRAWSAASVAAARPRAVATPVERGCPHDCGLCADHRQQSCCVLLEVTSRCDLACPVCYAAVGQGGRDLSLAEIDARLDTLVAAGGQVHVQLSGGEPTIRDDLPEIVRRIRARGFDFVQINSNGVRLACDPDYLRDLVAAGLDCVFLQFDGVDDGVHRALRGARLMRLKARAIAACGEAGVGVVLVPTVVPGVNDGQIGAIVDFAIAHMPTVRAVHFQPVAHFGRCRGEPATAARITLPEIVEALVAHAGGALRFEDFRAGSAENPFCSFSGRFRVDDAGRLAPRPGMRAACCGTPAPAVTTSCCGGAADDGSVRASPDVARARRAVAGQWTLPPAAAEGPRDGFDAVLVDRARTLGLSGMAFQDAWTLDLERLRSCHVHVVADGGRLIPFCAYNLTATDGRSLYRSPAEAGA